MSQDNTERTPLLSRTARLNKSKSPVGRLQEEQDASSVVESYLSKEELALGSTAVGERLPYSQYTAIDWLHELVKDSYRYRAIHGGKGIRKRLLAGFDAASGWIAVMLAGALTAFVAFLVDIAEAPVSDWKYGICTTNPFHGREGCCRGQVSAAFVESSSQKECENFHKWSDDYYTAFAVYGAFALAYGVISCGITLTTKHTLPMTSPGKGDKYQIRGLPQEEQPGYGTARKVMYMAAGSGIPEIKTQLSGFVIPHFLDFKVLVVKAVGAVFAVSTGMCLGKEGPFVHISACVGNLVACAFPRFRENGRKMREFLSAAIAAGLAVAFGAPIGGVLFAYEEMSTYFPRKVLWRAFLCSAVSVIVLDILNPNGTGQYNLFETHYAGTAYNAVHYLVFVFLGVAGGVWGGLFCKFNFMWSKWFRGFAIIKKHPVFEVFVVVLVHVVLQFPNPLTREPGDEIIRMLLVDCGDAESANSWVCRHELSEGSHFEYLGWLIYGTLVKLVLTIITFGTKVPSGVIIPALGAGSFFGRLAGQAVGTISPGIFAMVGAGAFLAGVSRMTVSLCVILAEVSGELDYILPQTIAILVAKWVADRLSKESVYDLAQNVLGHPFLDLDHALNLVRSHPYADNAKCLMPPSSTMSEITVNVPLNNKASRAELEAKLDLLKRRGLIDAGLVLVQNGMLQGYIAEGELEFGLNTLGEQFPSNAFVRILGDKIEGEDGLNDNPDEENPQHVRDPTKLKGDIDLSMFVDRTPLTVCEAAPVEHVLECFGKLGLRYMMITEEGTGKLVGVIIKKRVLAYLESLQHDQGE
ncbi:MAG: hypothetical protein M1831_003000 [Alyxoria varia]|nr:MAG: hypothetical protein M1831_003000 [Alyxoria varia]